MTERYELVLTPPAVRAVQSRLPEAVAAAVTEFVTGPLLDNPRRAGKVQGVLAWGQPLTRYGQQQREFGIAMH